MKKTVLINVTNTIPIRGVFGDYISGIGQATKALVSALNELEGIPYNLELYATGIHSYKFDFYGWNFKHHSLPMPLSGKLRQILGRHPDSILRPKLYKYDLFHITESYFDIGPKEPFIVTIHDCTDMDKQYSEDVDENTRERLQKRYQEMASLSKSIVTDSLFSKAEIVKFFNVPPEKVFVNYLGINKERFKILPEDKVLRVLQKFNIDSPYFFACSCNRPRKNLITALRAYKKFYTNRTNHIFVIAWSNPPQCIKDEFAVDIES